MGRRRVAAGPALYQGDDQEGDRRRSLRRSRRVQQSGEVRPAAAVCAGAVPGGPAAARAKELDLRATDHYAIKATPNSQLPTWQLRGRESGVGVGSST